ncbi:hypothetical protein Tcan_12003 [Toxocara canis]|uniref:Biogenesis of lysosome-related organelles complex 1 subunit 5 n=2 Tax=Toxocara canis TaxID=6265 RepID=A0A0B2UQP4_TOXCA|nr:hypothetical protein Tcan_12003 [Toxocara canis]VDM41974.1 unnamed protein product [Toxocara canis]
MSVAAVITDIELVGEHIFDHTSVIKKEIEKFLDNFERNERHKEFDGIIRASHTLVEATDTTLESLIAQGALERLNKEIKLTTDAVTSLTVPTFKQEHDEYLETVRRNQAEQLRVVENEIERQRRAMRERNAREGTTDSLTSPDMSTASEVDLN